MSQATMLVWVCVTPITLAAVLFIRHRKKKPLDLTLAEVISLSSALLAVTSTFQLLVKAFTLKQFLDLLGSDIAALVLGGVALIWVSLKEVVKLIE